MINLLFPSEGRSMNSCYGLWKQVRKTGPVHWEGRGDIEWCVCDICARTHTYAERVTSVSPITSFTRGTLCNISPSSNLPLSSLRVHSHARPSEQCHLFSTSVVSKRKQFDSSGEAFQCQLLPQWSKTTSYYLNAEGLKWHGAVGASECFRSCFGSVTYQLGKTLMVESFNGS